jgi:hypothetical protein
MSADKHIDRVGDAVWGKVDWVSNADIRAFAEQDAVRNSSAQLPTDPAVLEKRAQDREIQEQALADATSRVSRLMGRATVDQVVEA